MSTPKTKNGSKNKKWVHPSEALLRGHIVYNVKFLGMTAVERAKGTDVVKEAIRKLKFNKHLKKAEGQKPPKIELSISVDGVTLQEPKTKTIMEKCALHRISYCADDKSDKRMFSFIAKHSDSDQHSCYVFDSEKCAEELTMTVGQAFDLAYRRFLETSSHDMDMKKKYLLLQKKVNELTAENLALKAEIAKLGGQPKEKDGENYPSSPKAQNEDVYAEVKPVVGRKLENLLLDDESLTNTTPIIAPPPPIPVRNHTADHQNHIQSPSNHKNGDMFGMSEFNPNSKELDAQINRVDIELMDLKTGFSKGLSFSADDFNLDDLDPLKN